MIKVCSKLPTKPLEPCHTFMDLRTRSNSLLLARLRVSFAPHAELRSSPKESLPMREDGHPKLVEHRYRPCRAGWRMIVVPAAINISR